MWSYNDIFGIFNLELIRTYPREAVKFAKKHFNNKKISCIEIGVYYGDHALSMLKNLNIKKITLIDPYLKYEDYKRDTAYYDLHKAYKKAHKRLDKYSSVEWIKEFSHKAKKLIKKRVDLLYIDGNHDYIYVRRDLEDYWSKVKRGGIIAGHDIQASGVSKAITEFARKNNLDIFFGDRRDWWIIKK